MLRRRKRGFDQPMVLYPLHELWRTGLAPLAYWADANARLAAAQKGQPA